MPEHDDGEHRPTWRPKEAFFVPILGVVETVKHHHWNDMGDYRFNHHGESHIAAEGYNVR